VIGEELAHELVGASWGPNCRRKSAPEKAARLMPLKSEAAWNSCAAARTLLILELSR